MKKLIFIITIAATTVFILYPQKNKKPEHYSIKDYLVPKGWTVIASPDMWYRIGIDQDSTQHGKNVGTIKTRDGLDEMINYAIKKNTQMYGTVIKNVTQDGVGELIQNCAPARFLGKRIKMSGWLKTKDVDGRAGLAFRVNIKSDTTAAMVDDMHSGKNRRTVSGTNSWTKYELVLDVPKDAYNVAYGAYLAGKGQVWFCNINFETVTDSVPTTGILLKAQKNSIENQNNEPTNFDFDN